MMTITMAWERTVGNHRELIFACDSKLTGGEAWEGCPKLFTFERDDCILAFAGDTYYAYPVAVQITAALSSHKPLAERSRDIEDIAAHVVALLNGMLSRRRECDPPDTRFIFAGWSWKRSCFLAWTISRSSKDRLYHKIQTRRSGGAIAILGDPAEAERDVRDQLIRRQLLSAKNGHRPLNWEPFEVLRDIIRSGKYRAVGGPPQVAKVYPYAKTQIFAVYWSDGTEESLTFHGRHVLPYELPDNTVFDPDSFEVFNSRGPSHMMRVRKRFLRLLQTPRQ